MIRSQLNSITRLARAGALEQAWAQFHAAGFGPDADNPDVLTVYGRLLKDRAARESGAARTALLNDAIAAYARASALSRATYPLINAATLAFLTGRRDEATALAQQTLSLLDSEDCAPDTPYWLDATRAEALLLLGRESEADAILGQAIRHHPAAWEDHASTLRQFGLIAEEAGRSAAWIDRFRPPPTLHFDGIMGVAADDRNARQAISERIDVIKPGTVIGALAAGADILVAEAATACGGQLHAALPCPPELFCEASVAPFGGDWVSRFERLMDEAVSVTVLGDWEPLSNAAVQVAREAAMGLTIREGRRLQTFSSALRVWARGEESAQAGTDQWSAQGLPLHRILVDRSDSRKMALPGSGPAAALLCLPNALASAMPDAGVAVPQGKEAGGAVRRFATLAEAVDAAERLKALAPDARLGLDYRALPDGLPTTQSFDQVQALASANLSGSVALSEAAALALMLHRAEANVQPMGTMRARLGELSIYGLFVDPPSGDQIGE